MTPDPAVPAVAPIDTDEIRARNHNVWGPLVNDLCDEVDRLLARLDAAEAEAEATSRNFDTLVDVNADLAAERDAALARVLPEGAVSIVGERMAMVRQCTDVAQSGEFCVCPDSHRHGTGGGGCVCCSPGPLYRLIPYRPEKEAGT